MKESNARLNGDGLLEGTRKELSDSEELIEMIPIEGTPFTAVRNDTDWMLCMGKYVLEKGYKTSEEIMILAGDTSWNRLLSVIGVMIEQYGEYGEIMKRLEILERRVMKLEA